MPVVVKFGQVWGVALYYKRLWWLLIRNCGRMLAVNNVTISAGCLHGRGSGDSGMAALLLQG